MKNKNSFLKLKFKIFYMGTLLIYMGIDYVTLRYVGLGKVRVGDSVEAIRPSSLSELLNTSPV
jgi:hypothetical protein